MHQRGRVQHFHRSGQRYGEVAVGAEDLAGQQRKRRPQAFAARRQQLLGGSGERRMLVVRATKVEVR